MRSHDETGRFLTFDGCRLEIDTGDLHGPDGNTVRLAPQPTRLLALLAASRGRLVTRNEISERLWPHGSVEVDQGIGYAMREVRKGIEAAGADPSLIETVPRRGFRIRVTNEPPLPPDTRSKRSPAGPMTVVALVAITLVALATLTWPAIFDSTTSAPPVIVVFGHRTPAGDANLPLALGLGTTLTTILTRDYTGRLRVVGPTGTSSLSGPDDTDGARTRMGACLVLSGSVRAADDRRTVVFTQLVRTSDRVHVWASTDTITGADTDADVGPLVSRIVAGVEGAVGGCDR